MNKFWMIASLVFLYILNANAGLFTSDEEDVFNLVKNEEYKKALEIIEKNSNFNPNKYKTIYYADDINIAQALIKKGVNINEKIKYKDVIIKVLKLEGDEKYFDNTPLFTIKNAEVLKLLIDNGADVNARGEYNETPLINAKTFSALKVFLENGAEVNAQTRYGSTALKQIVDDDSKDKNKHLETLKMTFALLLKKADPNIQDNGGHTALHNIRWGHVDIAKLLVASGAKIDIQTPHGNTPLCYAISDSKMELIKFYFRAGANFDFTCENGMSLVEYSTKKHYENSSVTKFLIKLEDAMSQGVEHENK